jgi:hypothetical protein
MKRIAIFAVTVMLALLTSTGREVRATEFTRNVVFEWNQILQDTIPGAGSVAAVRYYGITHIAMFDAINAIDREFEPYRVRLPRWSGGSPIAAAAQSAHDVLSALNPAAAAAYDALLAKQLGRHPVASSGAARRSGPVWRRSFWRGARLMAGSSVIRQGIPSQSFRDAGSRRRRIFPPRHSLIFRPPRHWPCSPRRSFCRRRR